MGLRRPPRNEYTDIYIDIAMHNLFVGAVGVGLIFWAVYGFFYAKTPAGSTTSLLCIPLIAALTMSGPPVIDSIGPIGVIIIVAAPAIAAGISDRLWDMVDIVKLIDEAAPKSGPRGPYKKRGANA